MTAIGSIWVDADACPAVIKEILYRAADRLEVPVVLVANQPLSLPVSRWLSARQVAHGLDAADHHIAEHVAEGDLVITADIPLAAEVLEQGARVITPRGESLTANNIRQRLNLRDFMDVMRGSGVITGGPPPLSQRDRQAFGNALDKLLTRYGTG